MTPNLEIALRFIFSRKRSMLMSLAGIIFGVGFFIVTQAQTSGFEQFYIQTIIGTNSAVRIEDRIQSLHTALPTGTEDNPSAFLAPNKGFKKYVQGIEYPEKLRQAVEDFSDVTMVSEVLQGNVTAESIHNSRSAEINGIRINDHIGATNINERISFGSLEDFRHNPNAVMMGSKLANLLRIDVGDYVVLSKDTESRRYLVAAIFETGVTQIDKKRIFMHINEARSILKKPFGGAIFQIALKDDQKAAKIAAHMEATLRHNVISWQEREKTWLEVFRALRVSSAITVSSIILISGLGMFNTLAMIVMEKTREIAILRSMGYTQKDISHIFLWQGSLVLLMGTILGWGFGALVTYGISNLPIRIRGIFSTDTFVVNWDINHYISASIIAFVIVMIASYFPSRKAAKIEPGEIIRGTS